jgi:RNA polymerase sigma factor (sigma-70 family)
MKLGQDNSLLRYIRRLTAKGAAEESSDRQLLEQFVVRQDETAFAALLQRHGPLVWGVCRRLLHDANDADDAFQATFLVFVQKAASIGRGEHLAPWLYGVAYRIAVRARANAAKRRFHETRVAPRPLSLPAAEAGWRDLRPILDEEIGRLPEKYRLPLILCYLQGKTNQQAAHQLGCPKGTVLSRLARARERLRCRLTRRGVTLSSALVAELLAAQATPAAVPTSLACATLKLAALVAAGELTTAGVLSTNVAALTQGALTTMFLTKTKTLIAAALVVAIGAAGAGDRLLGWPAFAFDQSGAIATPAAADPGKQAKQEVPSQRDGVLQFIGTEIKEGENVPDSLTISVQVGEQTKKFRRLREGDIVEKGQLLARLDDRVWAEVAQRKKPLEAAEAAWKAADKERQEYHARYLTEKKLWNTPNAYAEKRPLDLKSAELHYEIANYNALSKKKALELAELLWKDEQVTLQVTVKRCEIRSEMRGVLKRIYKQPGEAVKSLEPVFLIEELRSDK